MYKATNPLAPLSPPPSSPHCTVVVQEQLPEVPTALPEGDLAERLPEVPTGEPATAGEQSTGTVYRRLTHWMMS